MSEFKKSSGLSFEEVSSALGLEKQRDILAKHWDISCESYKEDVFFLNEEFIMTSNVYFCFPDDILSIFNKTINVINNDRYLKILAWHMHNILFNYNDEENVNRIFINWPCFETSMGELSDMFGAVVFASGINSTIKFYTENGIPETIAKDTIDDFSRWMNAHRRKYGKLGFSEYSWLYKHFTGRIFRFGRLQFEPYIFKNKIVVYKNNIDNRIMVFSEAGITYRQDGQIDGTSGIFDKEGAWFSHLRTEEGKILGNPIVIDASCSKDTVCINEDDWTVVLRKNDNILNVHIHEGGKLDHDLCIKSYKEALEFFINYFPDMHFRAFTCHSWLLDVQLKGILPGSSNIVKFQGDFYCYPVYSPKEAQVYERVFRKYIENIRDMPENTFLQKAIKKYIKKGNTMRDGAGFILI